MDGAGQRPGHPQDLTLRTGDDLQVHAVPPVLAGVKRPVGRHPVDRDERAVDHHERVPGFLRRRQRRSQPRGAGGQQGLPARVELAPARPDLAPVAADDPGHLGQGLGRQRQRGTVEKHGSPCVDDEDLAIASSTGGFAASPRRRGAPGPGSASQSGDREGMVPVRHTSEG